MLKHNTDADTEPLGIDSDIFNALTSNLDRLVIRITADCKIVFANKYVEDLYGFAQSELIGKRLIETLIPKLDACGNWHSSTMELEMKCIEIKEIETDTITKDGQHIYIKLNKVPVFDNDGVVSEYLLIGYPIQKDVEYQRLLRISEDRYHQLFDSMLNGFLLCEIITNSNNEPIDYRYINANKGFETQTGIKVQDINGKLASKCLGRNRYLIEKLGRIGLHGGSTYFVEYFDNIDRYLEEYVFSPETGKIAIVMNDITERVRATEKLKASEARFRSIFEHASAGMGIASLDFAMVQVNDALCQITEYSKEELTGMNFKLLCHNDDWRINQQLLQSLLFMQLSTAQIEMRIQCKTGIYIWCFINFSLISNNDGTAQFLTIQVYNISVRVSALDELAKSKALLSNTQRLAKIGGWDLDLVTNEMSFTDEIYSILNLPRNIPHSLNSLLEFFTDQERIKLSEAIEDATELQTMFDLELQKQTANNEVLWIRAIGNPVVVNNTVTRITGSFQDITQRKTAEEDLVKSEKQLRQLNKTKDRLFAIVAHDLRNPFNSIIGLSDLLLRKFERVSPERSKAMIENILFAAQSAYDLLLNLLEWARTQTGKMTFIPNQVQLSDSIAGCLSLHQNMAINKKIQLQSNVPSTTFVVADRNMVDTIIRNLLSNALKFTEEGGFVNITAEHSDDMVIVTVADSGVGMNPEDVETIFDTLSSLSTDGTGKEKGTGLGLTLCKEFVARNGGKIWVESELGKGSRFRFTLPLSRDNG